MEIELEMMHRLVTDASGFFVLTHTITVPSFLVYAFVGGVLVGVCTKCWGGWGGICFKQ